MKIYFVVWTDKNGRECRWEYARREVAEQAAASLAEGWRDAHVEEHVDSHLYSPRF